MSRQPPARPVTPEQPVPELLVVLPARARGASEARHRLGGWLQDLNWPRAARADILLAVYEALANVVDHAYPAEVTGRLQLYARQPIEARQRRIIAVVTDSGRWTPPRTEPGSRGRGLLMMASCADRLLVQPGPGGTTVTLTSLAVPA